MPLLRWPHDHRRDLRACWRTSRPAVAQCRGQVRDAMTPVSASSRQPPAGKHRFPASQHYCPGASQDARDAGDHAKIARQQPTPRQTLYRDRRSVADYPVQRSPDPRRCPGKSPIDARLLTQPPRVPSWEAFGSRPSVRLERSRSAGIRNPAPRETDARRSGTTQMGHEERFQRRRLSGRCGFRSSQWLSITGRRSSQ